MMTSVTNLLQLQGHLKRDSRSKRVPQQRVRRQRLRGANMSHVERGQLLYGAERGRLGALQPVDWTTDGLSQRAERRRYAFYWVHLKETLEIISNVLTSRIKDCFHCLIHSVCTIKVDNRFNTDNKLYFILFWVNGGQNKLKDHKQ